MVSLDDLQSIIDKMAAVIEEVDQALKSAPPTPDAPEQVADKLGTTLGTTLDPLTPLAATIEEANAEAETMELSRKNKLQSIIEEKIQKTLEGHS